MTTESSDDTKSKVQTRTAPWRWIVSGVAIVAVFAIQQFAGTLSKGVTDFGSKIVSRAIESRVQEYIASKNPSAPPVDPSSAKPMAPKEDVIPHLYKAVRCHENNVRDIKAAHKLSSDSATMYIDCLREPRGIFSQSGDERCAPKRKTHEEARTQLDVAVEKQCTKVTRR